jgi:hypothetical protein
MLNRLICKIKGHNTVEAGSCPFTGLSYTVCKRCTKLSKIHPVPPKV